MKNDFSKGSVVGNILKLALPMTLAQLINVLYNVVDRIYIGNLPENSTLALTGLGVGLPIITMITAFTNLFGMGGAPLFSIERGRGNEKEAELIRVELAAAKVPIETIEKIVEEGKPIANIREAATTEIVGEKVRQKSLKIIMQAIKARGFVVDKNNIKIKRDTNEVIMVAQKASGEKAEFRVFLDGKFIYDFRGYEGQACQKDIRPFMKDLEEVYGVHVTKQTEIWSNPDKISTMKYQAINTNKNKA